MNILSIYTGHNSSICILSNGKILINLELERYSRIKHDYGYREDFLLFCLQKVNMSINDIDFIVTNKWSDNPPVRANTKIRPFEIPSTNDIKHKEFQADLLGKNFQCLAINHHLAHVASAFFTSPFSEAACLTIDGGGDSENSSFAFCKNNKIEVYEPKTIPDIAGWWSSVCFNNYRMKRIHELDPGSGAGKIMALAAYGKFDQTMYDQLVIDMQKSEFSENYFDKNAYAYNSCEDLSNTKINKSSDLAFALQYETEERLFKIFNELFAKFNCSNICYSGGLALNCIANTKVLKKSQFKNIHVPPCPNDSGLALGMALYAYYDYFNNHRNIEYFSPYTGPTYEEEVKQIIDNSKYKITDASVENVVNLLEKKEIIAMWQQKSETGPRALGHRSIICRTDIYNIKNVINNSIKHREWYRPYAPIVLYEFANEVFENCIIDSPYMTTSAVITKKYREKMSGVLHTDNTTRPQIIKKEHEPYIYEIISLLNNKIGIPAILNTSFNNQSPIVETPFEALETFEKMPIKYLVLDKYLIAK